MYRSGMDGREFFLFPPPLVTPWGRFLLEIVEQAREGSRVDRSRDEGEEKWERTKDPGRGNSAGPS